MNNEDFNKQYSSCIYGKGLQINNPLVCQLLHELFKDLIKIEDFKLFDIERNKGKISIYSTLNHSLESLIEQQLNKI